MRVLLVLFVLVASAIAERAAPAPAFVAPARGLARQGTAPAVQMGEHIHRAQVTVGETEPIESAVKRFRREVSRSGHLPLLRARRRFISNAEKRQDILKKEARRLRFTPPEQR